MKIKTTVMLIAALLLVASGVQAGLYSDKVGDLGAEVYYQMDQAAGAADGSAVVNAGTLGASYNGTWGSGLASYSGREAISGAARADTIGGQELVGLDPSGYSAQFSPTSWSDMISMNIGGEGGDPTALDTVSQTVSMFFKTSQADGWTRLMTKDPDGVHDFDLVFDNASGKLVLVNRNATSAAYEGETNYRDGAWHHIVAVRDSGAQGDMRLYVDGAAVALVDRGGSWSAGYGARFGAHGTSSSGAFDGYIDEIAIWDRALTATEAEGLFSAAIPEPATLGLVATIGMALLFVRRKLML